MNIKSRPCGGLRGSLRVISSKYHFTRAMIMGSLARGRTTITDASGAFVGKMTSTTENIAAFGPSIEFTEDACIIDGGDYRTPGNVIDVDDSGTTLQFLLGVVAATPGWTVFTGNQSLRRRPMKSLLDSLSALGVRCHSAQGDGNGAHHRPWRRLRRRRNGDLRFYFAVAVGRPDLRAAQPRRGDGPGHGYVAGEALHRHDAADARYVRDRI